MHKNKLKMHKNLNVRPEIIKLLQENIGKTLSNINHSRVLYDPPLRILEIWHRCYYIIYTLEKKELLKFYLIYFYPCYKLTHILTSKKQKTFDIF